MKNIYLTIIALINMLAPMTATAQFNYDVSVLQQTYQPLTSATGINDTTRWDEENYKIPFGFSFDMNGTAITNMSIRDGHLTGIDTNMPFTGFAPMVTDLYDRGNAGDSVTRSPIRYTITGTTGSRIFKLEYWNAGFFEEYSLYGTNDDSVCFQMWFYETSNIFEIRYGASKVTYPADYFFGSGPLVGFFKNLTMSLTMTKFYYFQGDPANPTLDSVSSFSSLTGTLDSFPPNGTVYRFTPKSTGIKSTTASATDVNVYPSICTGILNIENNAVNELNYTMLSVTGNVVQKGRLATGINQLQLEQLAAGKYMVQIQDRDKLLVKQFIKQ